MSGVLRHFMKGLHFFCKGLVFLQAKNFGGNPLFQALFERLKNFSFCLWYKSISFRQETFMIDKEVNEFSFFFEKFPHVRRL